MVGEECSYLKHHIYPLTFVVGWDVVYAFTLVPYTWIGWCYILLLVSPKSSTFLMLHGTCHWNILCAFWCLSRLYSMLKETFIFDAKWGFIFTLCALSEPYALCVPKHTPQTKWEISLLYSDSFLTLFFRFL